MTLWSHHVASRVTVRTCALQKSNWIRAPLWLQKNTHSADARARRFCVYRFWASGRSTLYYMCVEIPFYSAILFTSKFTDHMIAAKYDDFSGIFKRGKFSWERGETDILTFRQTNSFFKNHWTLITQRITFKGEIKLI